MGTSTPSFSGHYITRLKVDGVLPYLNPGVFQDQQACTESPASSPGKRLGNLKGPPLVQTALQGQHGGQCSVPTG